MCIRDSHIILACIGEAVHFSVIQNKNIPLFERIGIISISQNHASFQNIDNFHVIVEMYGILLDICNHYINPVSYTHLV